MVCGDFYSPKCHYSCGNRVGQRRTAIGETMMSSHGFSLSALDKRELDYLKAMAQSDQPIAVPEALHYCVKHHANAPRWLLAAAVELLCDLMKREKSKRRGRSGGYIARYRQALIDLERFEEVRSVRQKQMDIREEVEKLRATPNVPPSIMEERENMLAWVGGSLNRAFECAAMLLEGSQAYASPEAMKRSYFKVERNSRDPNKALRYHLLDPQFLRKIGIKYQIESRPGRKKVPLYELTI
jgi:hypothetical protein